MPELPEVQTVLDGLTKAIKGKQISSLECFYPGTVILDPKLGGDPFPATAVEFMRRGKYMLIHLDSGASLIIHLRMTGKLVAAKQAAGPQKHERARINLACGELLHFIDIRTFGKIILCKTDNIPLFMPQLGLEPLDKTFTPAALAAKLKGKIAPIKSALLNQRIIAGLGNIYVCEILYRTGINPTIPAGDLTNPALKRIVQETVQVLSEAIAMGGTSISDFRRIDDKTGEFQHFLRVYQKQTCPLGHPIERIVQAGRSTFYCPICQTVSCK
jgi:formamidopyrimidine-DNA glycosylase